MQQARLLAGSPLASTIRRKLNIPLAAGCLLALAVLSAPAEAQTFAPIPALSFTKPYTGADPLPQTISVAGVGSEFYFTVSSSTSSGGNWLSVATGGGCGPCSTPSVVTITASPSITLAAGTYSGQVVLTKASGNVSLTVPVSLTIAPSTSAFFDNVPGQMSFSFLTGASDSPPAQSIQLRNAGSGTLNWSLSTTTSDGGQWLSVSASSGTAPSFVTVTLLKQNLPGAGLVAGTFIGQLTFRATGGTSQVTVPVSVVVGQTFYQINAISFTKVFGGANPLPQTLTVSSTSSYFYFTTSFSPATGSSWLTATTGGGCSPCATTQVVTVAVNPSVTLAAGTYTGQVVFTEEHGSYAITVPVTLTVAPPPAAGPYFDNVPGQISFSVVTGSSTNPPLQNVQIRNAGTGFLDWTLTAVTADGGNWLTVSAPNGTAPSAITVGVLVANLPNAGLTAGTFIGNLTFQAAQSSVTIPVSIVVGASTFQQINAISFTKVFGGVNPLPQTLTVASTGTNFRFVTAWATATGGNWLSVSPDTSCQSPDCPTPQAISVAVTPGITLAAGTYTGQIVFTEAHGSQAITVPVTLTVAPPSAAGPYFDNLPGQISFFAQTGSVTNPAAQSLQVRNAGSGLLNWTLSAITSDGGNWLSVSASSGTAPSVVNVSIQLQNLPGLGLVPGTFSGTLTFSAAGSSITVPVSVVIGDSVFQQLNAVTFTTPSGGTNPLAQTLTVSSTGANFRFVAATGGSWLSVSFGTYCPNLDCGLTPQPITLTVTTSPTMASGTYSGQVVFTKEDGSMAMTVPVTLVVGPVVSGTGFQFVPVTPCRIADTRNPTGPFGGPIIGAGQAREFDVPNSACGIPPAAAYSLNVTVVPTASLGYLTIWPTGDTQPVVSTLNSLDGRIKANAAIVPSGTNGGVSVFVSNQSNVILDIDGYFTPSAASPLQFFKLAPCRIADTRQANGVLGSPSLSGGTSRTFPVLSSTCGIPATAQAYSLNMTVVPHGTLGYITTYPTGASKPTVSTLNALTGAITANAALVPAGTSGSIDVFASNDTDLVIDINGYFAPSANGGLSLYTMAPCRVKDTRLPTGTPPFSGAIAINAEGSACAPPANAQAYVLNATVVPPASTPLGYLTLWPDGDTRPVVSTLNALDGAITSNMAIVPTTNGAVDAYASSPTYLILDISSYFAP